MRILVTGGAGRVGKAAVERLARAGHAITVFSRAPGSASHGARSVRGDITDISSLLPAMEKQDAVVHLAAIPAPGGFRPEEIFRVNALGTFSVYEAAARAGIRRVVTASSINAVGLNFGVHAFPIAYLPVDERLPGFSTDAYSFSKQVTESIAEYAWRRDGISSICLRLPGVAPEKYTTQDLVATHAAACRASMEKLMALPEAERRRLAARWVAHRDAYRAGRHVEALREGLPYHHPDPLVSGRTDFWTRIDERDAAQAIEKSLTAGFKGCRTLFVNDTHNCTGVPSLVLAELFFPEARRMEKRLAGTSTLVSVDDARELIGFEPEHSIGRWL